MKNKTKIMLGLAALTAGTLAAGATGTFAWFTTNKTATATYSKIVVAGTNSNLQCAITGITDTSANASLGATASATSSGSYMSDVSSKDGVTFYQPDWTGTSDISSGAYSSLKTYTGTAGSQYYTQYIITITNVKNQASSEEGASSAVADVANLVLKSITVTSNKTTNANAVNWTRIATNVLTSNEAISANQTHIFQNQDQKANKYVTGTVTSGKMSDVGALGELTTIGTFNQTTASDQALSSSALKLSGGQSVYIGVSIWLEGTMANGQELAAGEEISVSMVFGDKTATA